MEPPKIKQDAVKPEDINKALGIYFILKSELKNSPEGSQLAIVDKDFKVIATFGLP